MEPIDVSVAPEAFHVRPAAPADIGTMLDMWAEMVREHAEIDPRFQLAPGALDFQRPYFLMALRDENWTALVAAEAESRELAGFATGKVDAYPPTVIPHRFGLVSDVYVRPSWRRRGLGRRLFDALAGWFTERGVAELELNVLVGNHGAARFWEELGFREVLARLSRRLGDGQPGATPRAKQSGSDRGSVTPPGG